MQTRARIGDLPHRWRDDFVPLGFDDPVPSDSTVMIEPPAISRSPHSLERQVQRKLLAQPQLQFSSLVVRRMPDGVCLEGVLESTDGSDLCTLARQVEGVIRVLDHVMVRPQSPGPAEMV